MSEADREKDYAPEIEAAGKTAWDEARTEFPHIDQSERDMQLFMMGFAAGAGWAPHFFDKQGWLK